MQIMQGRIVKVINMKPLETLGLIEEAAGTRMFEMKKKDAIKTIEKKETKLAEINRVRLLAPAYLLPGAPTSPVDLARVLGRPSRRT